MILMEHPYLELGSEEILEEVPDLSAFVDLFDAMGGEEPEPEVVAQEQAILDAKVRAWFSGSRDRLVSARPRCQPRDEKRTRN